MRTAPRLKWHRLRRRRGDASFLRANLEAGIRAGAPIEVDLVATADGEWVCLHDSTLDRETTGVGPAGALRRSEIEQLRQRADDGTPLADPPLFLDEVIAACRRHGMATGGRVQLDVKETPERLDSALLGSLGRALGEAAPACIASGYDWPMIERLAAAAPGLHKGFDPYEWHEAQLPETAADFEALALRTLREAPGATLYYLYADLVLAGLDRGVNLVALVGRAGAEVDAWTIDTDRPNLEADLARLIEAGCHQITTNEPEELGQVIQEILTCS
jgi:glycerophosphoryl diester phosphodiesterase